MPNYPLQIFSYFAIGDGAGYNISGTYVIDESAMTIELTDDDPDFNGYISSDANQITLSAVDSSNGGNIPAGSEIGLDGRANIINNTTGESGFAYHVALAYTQHWVFTIPVANGDSVTFSDYISLNSSSITYAELTGGDIVAANAAPSGADNTLTLNEDSAATLKATDFGFTDSDGDTLQSVTITSLPTNGTLTLDGNAVSTGQVVTLAQLDADQLAFATAANGNGTGYASFTFQVADNGGTANGGQNTDQTANTLTFDVTAVNDAPVIAGAGGGPALGGMGMIAEWTDLESGSGELPSLLWGDTNGLGANRIGLSVEFANGLSGTVIYNNISGLWNTTFSGIASELATGFFASAQGLHFLYANGTSLPMAWEDFQMPFSGNFDLDFNNQLGSHFRADQSGWGSAVFRTFSDAVPAAGDEAYTEDTPLNLTDIVVNDVDSASVTVTLTFSDVAAGSLTTGTSGAVTSTYDAATGVWAASGATADVNALLAGVTYNPAANFNGDFTLGISVSDGTAPAVTATKTFTGVAVNDAPVIANAIADHNSAEDTAVSYQVPADAFSDVDNATLTYTAALEDGNPLPSWLVFDAGTRTFSGTPSQNFNASLSITVTASDGALAASDTFNFNITEIDDAAVARADRFIVNADAVLTGNVLANNGQGADFDLDGPALQVGAVDGVSSFVGQVIKAGSGATLRIEADGALTYTPGAAAANLAWSGSGASNTSLSDNFEYTLVGGGTGNVTVVVQGVDKADTVSGTSGDDRLFGGAFDDVLLGLQGADALDGGSGIDAVSYASDEGSVFINLTLGRGYANASFGDTYISIENVIGTGYDDFIIGDTGVNRLDGGVGNDTLIGAVAADVLIGGTGTDIASYEDNSGTVFVNLTLGRGYNNAAEGDTYEGIENLKGGLFDDFFIGDEQANRLDGAMGADTLLGAAGADVFVFSHAPGATSQWGSANVDTILDFQSGVDKIELASAVFSGMGLGSLNPNAFVMGTSAQDADDRIIYDQATGNLYFDVDGSGSGAAVLFAALDNKASLAATDFIIA